MESAGRHNPAFSRTEESDKAGFIIEAGRK
jgi:hypothetical protein